MCWIWYYYMSVLHRQVIGMTHSQWIEKTILAKYNAEFIPIALLNGFKTDNKHKSCLIQLYTHEWNLLCGNVMRQANRPYHQTQVQRAVPKQHLKKRVSFHHDNVFWVKVGEANWEKV